MSSVLQIGDYSSVEFLDNLHNDAVVSLDDDSVALTFTSPPYYDYIDYKGGEGVGDRGESYLEYINTLRTLFAVIHGKTMPNGKMVINISNMKSRKAVEGRSFIYPIVGDIVRVATMEGFDWFDEIIWDKNISKTSALQGQILFGSYPYPTTPKILDSIFENILVFRKDGTRPKVDDEIKEQSILTQEEWREWTRGIWRIRTDVNPEHPATFPIELAERVIRMYSFVGDIVLDPFVGTGTTVVAAEKWNRVGIGYEISEEYRTAIVRKSNQQLNKQTSFL